MTVFNPPARSVFIQDIKMYYLWVPLPRPTSKSPNPGWLKSKGGSSGDLAEWSLEWGRNQAVETTSELLIYPAGLGEPHRHATAKLNHINSEMRTYDVNQWNFPFP